LQISTASVYGDCSDEIASEETQLNPLSPYALGKARADDNLAVSNSKWLILRATSIYSDALNKRVLGRLRNGLINSEHVTLGGTGYELRDFMHVNDFSRALLTLAVNKKSIHNVFLVGCGSSLQIAQVADIAMSSFANRGGGFFCRV
jgi:nucleoside-diphosphate-sugar epimerase